MESKITRLKRVDDCGQGGYLSNSIGLPDMPTKDLYVIFSGERLSYWCVPVSSLLSPSPTPTRLVFDAESSEAFKYCCSGVCFARWKHWLYVIGGDDSEGITGKRNEINEYGSAFIMYTSCYVMRLAIFPPILTGNPAFCERSPMHSGKGVFSISIVHKDIIYVFGKLYNRRAEYTFESYNPMEDKWCVIDIPLIYGYRAHEICCYVVIGDKICISTETDAFSYDTNTKKWESCHLFDGVKDYFIPHWFPKEKRAMRGGSPFGFYKEGLLFENEFLLCVVTQVIAYRIKGGGVVGKQFLLDIYDFHDGGDVLLGSLVELGNGYYCYSFTSMISDELCKLIIVTFKISRLRNDSDDKFLFCEVRSRQDIQVDRDLYTDEPFAFAV